MDNVRFNLRNVAQQSGTTLQGETTKNSFNFKNQVSHKARAFKDSFFVSTVKLWNSLLSAAVNSATLVKFKGHNKQHQTCQIVLLFC